MRPIVLTIAGSDSCGGAGIQADLKAIEAWGGHAATAITAITAQNTRGVLRAEALAPDLVRDQIEAVFADLRVAAVKTGMLASAAIVREVARCLAARAPSIVVVDPVLLAKSGDALLADDARSVLAAELLPLATLLTPNVHEAEALSGFNVHTPQDAERAGRALVQRGARAVLVKGGHLESAPATDVLVTAAGSRVFEGPFIDTPHTHGTGCTYASAIATLLARGFALERAVREAKAWLTEAIRHARAIGGGHGSPDPFWAADAQASHGDVETRGARAARRASRTRPADAMREER